MILSFGVQNYDACYNKHRSRVNKLQYEGIGYDDILAPDVCKRIAETVESMQPGLSAPRQFRTLVNSATRDGIIYGLKRLGLPAAWDTAFYMQHYESVNRFMDSIAQKY